MSMMQTKHHRKKKKSPPNPAGKTTNVNDVIDKVVITTFGGVLHVNSDSTTNDDKDGVLSTCMSHYGHSTFNSHRCCY